MRGERVVILSPGMAADLARECDRTGIVSIRQEKDGMQVIQVVDWEGAKGLDRDMQRLLDVVAGLRFKVVERIAGPARQMSDQRQRHGEHMAQLRKRTGQDWRGRR